MLKTGSLALGLGTIATLLVGCSAGSQGANPATQVEQPTAGSMSAYGAAGAPFVPPRSWINTELKAAVSSPPRGSLSERRSWNDSKGQAVVFVSDGVQGAVKIYAQRSGRLVGQLTRNGGIGLATDLAGDLYVACADCGGVLVYPPGSTSPSLVLSMPPPSTPFSVAVSKLGEVAVGYLGGVSFFKHGKTRAFKSVSAGSIGNIWYVAYDSKGNLYLDASNGSGTVTVGAIVGGGKGNSINVLQITNVQGAGSVAVDKSDRLLVLDYKAAAIYQYQLPNPIGPSGTVSLTGAQVPLTFALTKSNSAVYVANANGFSESGYVWRFAYPAGGSPAQTINDYGDALSVALSPEQQP